MTLGLQGPSTWVRKGKGQLGNGQSFRAQTTQCFAPGWGVQGCLSLLHAELGLPLCGIIPGSTGDRPCRPHTEGARVRGWVWSRASYAHGDSSHAGQRAGGQGAAMTKHTGRAGHRPSDERPGQLDWPAPAGELASGRRKDLTGVNPPPLGGPSSHSFYSAQAFFLRGHGRHWLICPPPQNTVPSVCPASSTWESGGFQQKRQR